MIDRLTSINWRNVDLHGICGQDDRCAGNCAECLAPDFYRRAAEYEDTGLTPEAIAAYRWIPVSERLPEKFTDDDGVLINYLIAGPNTGVDIGCYFPAAGVWLCVGLPVTVTHWMPLPKAPEVEQWTD